MKATDSSETLVIITSNFKVHAKQDISLYSIGDEECLL
jgi:hypothetical protein